MKAQRNFQKSTSPPHFFIYMCVRNTSHILIVALAMEEALLAPSSEGLAVLLYFDLLTRPKLPFKVMHRKEVTHSNCS